MVSRLSRVTAALCVALPSITGSPIATANSGVSIDALARTSESRATQIVVHLPPRVSAVEGRVLMAPESGELIGVATDVPGQTLAPIEVAGGYAWAAYDLAAGSGATSIYLVVAPRETGRHEVRVVFDAAADASGRRITLERAGFVATIRVGGDGSDTAAPDGLGRAAPARPARPIRNLIGDAIITADDVHAFRAGWYAWHEAGSPCAAAARPGADANQDGCVDVVDAQALAASIGRRADGAAPGTKPVLESQMVATIDTAPPPRTAVDAAPRTFVVTSTSDTPDAAPGDGACADSSGRCTLRAALTESNWNSGSDRIEFDLAGTAPVRIQLGSTLPNVGSGSGGVVIDGYSQPGSRVNSASFGTNAIPGVELRGTGTSMSFALYVAQAGNTIRGLLINEVGRAIFLDGSGARQNRIVGNFLGFRADNSLPPRGKAGIVLNNGANQNVIGSPVLADRNIIGNFEKGIFSYGAGTDGNVTQNNVLCMTASGSTAICQIAMDHDFGPKNSLVGGTAANERNVIGPTNLNGLEFSHGWNPANHQSTTTWQINGNRVVGNWIGFRPNGDYSAAYRTAQNVPTFDNGQGINIYDGTNANVVEGNFLAAVYGGMSSSISNATGNIFRDNVIGESPNGQAAPLARWGIYFLSNTRGHVVEGNVIRNAGSGGVALLDHNSRDIRISRNIVTGTNGPAIYLTPNPNDPSTGANLLLPPPQIGGASTSQATGTGIPGARVEIFLASRAAGQSGLPIQYLGSATVSSSGSWSVPFSTSIGSSDRVTGLQIRSDGNTTQLSPNVVASGSSSPPSAPEANFSWSQQAGTLSIAFTDTSSGSPATWSWQFGDGGTSSQQNPTRAYAAAGSYQVVLTVTNAGGSDQVSRTVTVTDPQPPPTGVLAADAFSRTTADGWGSADVGGAYGLEGSSSSFSVDGGAGIMSLPARYANRAVFLPALSVRDVDLRVLVSAGEVPTVGSHYLYAVVRRNGTNAYRPKIIISASGSVAVHAGVVVNNSESSVAPAVTVPGITYTSGMSIWLRAQVEGSDDTTIRVKAWVQGQPEPSGWQFVATNGVSAVQGAGSVGLRVYSSATNAPYDFRFDDLRVEPLV